MNWTCKQSQWFVGWLLGLSFVPGSGLHGVSSGCFELLMGASPSPMPRLPTRKAALRERKTALLNVAQTHYSVGRVGRVEASGCVACRASQAASKSCSVGPSLRIERLQIRLMESLSTRRGGADISRIAHCSLLRFVSKWKRCFVHVGKTLSIHRSSPKSSSV